MASRASSKTLNYCYEPEEVSVGAKVARYFASHELASGNHPQWIHGKVSGFKLVGAGGKKGSKTNTTWWTLLFETPATKALSCNTEEVVLMLQAAHEFRLKRYALEQNMGKHMLVLWREEDSDLSLTEWGNEFRVCKLAKYLSRTQQFVLSFKCGYTKIVDANAVVQLFDESESLYASTKIKTKRSVALATQEWDSRGEKNLDDTRVLMDVASESKVQKVNEAVRKALAQRLEDTRENETNAKRVLAEQYEKQRVNVLQMQKDEAVAAQLKAAHELKAKEDAAALVMQQQTEAAAELKAKEVAANKLKAEEAAAAFVLQQQTDAATEMKTKEAAAAAADLKAKEVAAEELKAKEAAAAEAELRAKVAAAALVVQQQTEEAAELKAKEVAANELKAKEVATALVLQQQTAAAAELKFKEVTALELKAQEVAAALVQQLKEEAAIAVLVQKRMAEAAIAALIQQQKEEADIASFVQKQKQDAAIAALLQTFQNDLPLTPMALADISVFGVCNTDSAALHQHQPVATAADLNAEDEFNGDGLFQEGNEKEQGSQEQCDDDDMSHAGTAD